MPLFPIISSEKINILAALHEIVGSNSKEHIDTLLGPIDKLEGNIALLRVKANVTVDMPVMVDVVDGFLKCFPGQKKFVILDCIQRSRQADIHKIVANASMDSLNHAAYHAEFNKNCMAQAIVADRLAISLIANFYAVTLKKNMNVKLVKHMSEAHAWLKGKVDLLELKQPSWNLK